MQSITQQFSHVYAQRAALEALILAGIAGTLGPWVLMRGLGFFAHAIGSASFPGLILADALGILPQAGAAIGSAVVASGSGILRPSVRNGTRTGLWLTGSLAAGALIASDWSKAGAGVDAALFGSLLTTDWLDILTATAALLAAVVATRLAGPRWLAQGLLGRPPKHWDALLLGVAALAVIAQLPATGALLASTMLVLPAAAAQPWSDSVRSWQWMTAAFACLVGLGGLLASLSFDTPPGGTIALLSGVVVAISVGMRWLTLRGNGRTAATAAGIAAAVAVSGCGPSSSADVVTGTPIVESITKQVAGNNLSVRSLVPAGADPHSWEPRPSDTEALAGAKLLILSGGGIDAWAKRLHARTDSTARILDLYPTLPLQLTTPGSSSPDPHWFQDPTDVAAAAGAIATELGRISPANAPTFKARAARFQAEARALGRQAKACVARLTPNERRVVTDHDAFRYLASRLGLHIQGALLSSQSTAASPTPKEINDLLDQIRTYKVKAVFPERSLDTRLAHNIAAEAGVRSDVKLDSDTLGPVGAPDASWTGMWTGNVSRLVSALSAGRVQCRFGAPA